MTINRRGFVAAVVAALGLHRLRPQPKPVLQSCWNGDETFKSFKLNQPPDPIWKIPNVAATPEDSIYMGSFVNTYDPVTDKTTTEVSYRLYTCPRAS